MRNQASKQATKQPSKQATKPLRSNPNFFFIQKNKGRACAKPALALKLRAKERIKMALFFCIKKKIRPKGIQKIKAKQRASTPNFCSLALAPSSLSLL
jgi:hypothetical protein